MFFQKKEEDNIVHINDINELKLAKIKPSDLTKIYIDKNGQEYKLRYDQIKKKVIIVKIIKSVLDGSFMKNKYDATIAPDKDVETVFKYKMGELSKQVFHDKYKTPENGIPLPVEVKPEQTKPKLVVTTDNITLSSVNDVYLVMKKIDDRLEMALKNLYDSNIFNERLSYDDKIVLDDITRLLRNSIIENFQNTKMKYEHILRGYDDAKIKSILFPDEVKKITEPMNSIDRLNFLRAITAIETFITEAEAIIKIFSDLDYKLTIIPEEKIAARIFAERQKFNDAKITLNTCKNDTIKIVEFFKSELNKKLY